MNIRKGCGVLFLAARLHPRDVMRTLLTDGSAAASNARIPSWDRLAMGPIRLMSCLLSDRRGGRGSAMGTDIYTVVEHLSGPDVFPWVLAETGPESPWVRGYHFFELLRHLGTPGMPDDISDIARAMHNEDVWGWEESEQTEHRKRYGECSIGDWGHHHLTLETLFAFDWDTTMDVLRWKGAGDLALPTDSALVPRGDPSTTKWREAARDFLPFAERCAAYGRPHEVRLLFGFD